MPAHIYSRVSRWHDAVVANQRAIGADEAGRRFNEAWQYADVELVASRM